MKVCQNKEMRVVIICNNLKWKHCFIYHYAHACIHLKHAYMGYKVLTYFSNSSACNILLASDHSRYLSESLFFVASALSEEDLLHKLSSNYLCIWQFYSSQWLNFRTFMYFPIEKWLQIMQKVIGYMIWAASSENVPSSMR